MSVVQGFSGNSQEILTSDFPCLHKPVGFSFFILFCTAFFIENLNSIILRSMEQRLKNNYQEINKMLHIHVYIKKRVYSLI